MYETKPTTDCVCVCIRLEADEVSGLCEPPSITDELHEGRSGIRRTTPSFDSVVFTLGIGDNTRRVIIFTHQ